MSIVVDNDFEGLGCRTCNQAPESRSATSPPAPACRSRPCRRCSTGAGASRQPPRPASRQSSPTWVTRRAWSRRACATIRTNVIGILVADLEPFSTELLKGAADVIRGTGYELVVYSASGRASDHVGWERRYLSRLSGTLIDGAILVTPTVVDVALRRPDRRRRSAHRPERSPDDRLGQPARRAVRRRAPVALGHRRIAMLTGRPDLQSALLREQGYRGAVAAAGIDVDESLIVEGAYDPEVSNEHARQLLGHPDPPTAIFAANDLSAIATIEVAAEYGLRRARRPVGRRFRQRPRVRDVHAAADHRRAADPADGPAGCRSAHPAHPWRGGGGHPHHARDPPRRAAVDGTRTEPIGSP